MRRSRRSHCCTETLEAIELATYVEVAVAVETLTAMS
jgi:hypothetical protein